MNILNDKNSFDSCNKNEIEQVQQQKQEFKLLGTYLKTPGLNLYCYNPHTNTIEEVTIIKPKTCIMITLDDGSYIVQPYEKSRIEVNPNWDYFEKSNMSNAIKHLNKYKQGKIKTLWNLKIPPKNGSKIKFY